MAFFVSNVEKHRAIRWWAWFVARPFVFQVARVDEDHPTQQAVLAAAADPTATVLVNKEIPIPAEMVEALPSSVKLICEVRFDWFAAAPLLDPSLPLSS